MRIVKYCTIFLASMLFLMTSCREKKNDKFLSIYSGFAQGTTFSIKVKDSVEHNFIAPIDSILKGIDMSMSVFEPNSLISRLNRNETDSLDAYIKECIQIAERLSKESGGIYDITIKPLTSAYGFTGDGAMKDPNVDSLMQYVGYKKISIEGGRLVKENPNIQLDLNSIAQGYTVDVIARYFDSMGYKDYIIEVGGEVFSRGTNMSEIPWIVGIDKPVEGNAAGKNIQVMIGLSGKGLATSGNYRKFYTDDSGRKIVHTVDATTGEPVISNMLSATVVADDATLADVYGTFFMAAGLEKSIETLEKNKDLAAYIIYSDDSGKFQVYATENLNIIE